MKAVKIKGSVKTYSWGNDYFIPHLLNTSSKGPVAEYWLGTHSYGEAKLEGGFLLSDYINSDIKGALGDKKSLPILLKVLAIGSPISLHTHPDDEDAEEGYKKEEGKRIKREDFNYWDEKGKDELIFALSPLTALVGFRGKKEAEENFRKYIPKSFERLFHGRVDGIREMFMTLFSPSFKAKIEVLNELRENVYSFEEHEKTGSYLTLSGAIIECFKNFPGDMGAIAPLFMNLVHLDKNEALFVKRRTIHTYLRGDAIELMDSSDNVLRSGLTKKRVDLGEFEKVSDFTPLKIEKAKEEKDEKGRIKVIADSPSFTLYKISNIAFDNPSACSIILSLEGKTVLDDRGKIIELKRGEAAFIPVSASVKIRAEGTAFQAEII